MIGRELLRSAISRNLRNGLLNGHSLKGGLSVESVIKFKHSPDHLTLYADAPSGMKQRTTMTIIALIIMPIVSSTILIFATDISIIVLTMAIA